MVKLFQPFVPSEAITEVAAVLKSPCITQGPLVNRFEEEFKKLFDVKHAVSVNSGTSALEIAYDLIGLKEGDEVITTPFTCAATNIPLLHRKVKIVWADILEDSLTIDPLDVRAKITGHTKAIIQVHLGGVRADVGRMHIPVVSDACQALGIFSGDITCCSFQAIKHVTTGDGGMVVPGMEHEADTAKLLRWFGIDRDRVVEDNWMKYRTRMMCFDIDIPGYKRHMNDIAAAMGIAGLRFYQRNLNHRKAIFAIYKERLGKVDGIKVIDGRENVCWLATLLVEKRDAFARWLYCNEIETNLVQVRNDVYKVFGGEKAVLPALENIEDKYISIPIGPHVSLEDANEICNIIERGW